MIAVFALAQLVDGLTAVAAVLTRPSFREGSIIPAMLLARPEWALIVKLLATVVVIAAILIIERSRPRLATGLLALGIVAAAIGALSNIAVLAA